MTLQRCARSLWFLFFLNFCAGMPALAADRVVTLKSPPHVRKGLDPMPEIADPQDEAELRINSALAKLDAVALKSARECFRNDEQKQNSYERTVEATMRGPRFLSYMITDDTDCGGPYPNVGFLAIVYDLRTGKPVDWTTLLPKKLTGKVSLETGYDGTRTVTLASPRLLRLYLARYGLGDEASPDCPKDDNLFGSGYSAGMMVWLDAKLGGLALRISLPHVIQVCEQTVVLPALILRREGAAMELVDAVEAAHKARSY